MKRRISKNFCPEIRTSEKLVVKKKGKYLDASKVAWRAKENKRNEEESYEKMS